ncbi:hypothetical protein BQ8420_03940 [Nocardiopsis sp. JB363]|nr:hypothetical protein BQ8420_03940 [Nocardiopsis sp. JB363]
MVVSRVDGMRFPVVSDPSAHPRKTLPRPVVVPFENLWTPDEVRRTRS